MKRRRRRRKKQMRIVRWFKKLSTPNKVLLIAGAVIFCLLAALVIYVAVIYGKLNIDKIDRDEIIINELEESTGEGYTNFALFGGDSRTGDVTRDLNTDCIIVASLNNKTKEVKLVSVYRDTLLDLSNGSIRKCNSAYSNGGATMAINMLNMNLDLDIQKYVTVDFGAVAELVDMLGGIEIDVSEKEWVEVNKYIDETGMVANKKAIHLTHGGLQTLDGVQATTYARIRKNVGDDYARTERQRLVIQKIAEKAIRSDLGTINKIINEIFPRIATNLTLTEVLSYAKSFTRYKITETTGFPFDKGSGKIPGKGDSVFPVTLKTNVSKLHEFLYGTKDYVPSSKVGSISAEIASIVGNRQVDPTPSTQPGTGTETNPGTPNNPSTETPNPENPEKPGTDVPNPENPDNKDPDNKDPDNKDPGNENPGGGNETPGGGDETPGGGDENPGGGNAGSDNGTGNRENGANQ